MRWGNPADCQTKPRDEIQRWGNLSLRHKGLNGLLENRIPEIALSCVERWHVSSLLQSPHNIPMTHRFPRTTVGICCSLGLFFAPRSTICIVRGTRPRTPLQLSCAQRTLLPKAMYPLSGSLATLRFGFLLRCVFLDSLFDAARKYHKVEERCGKDEAPHITKSGVSMHGLMCVMYDEAGATTVALA